MEQEGDWDKIYNHFGYMAENETEAKKKLLYFAVESIYALSDSDCENMLVLFCYKFQFFVYFRNISY